MSIADTPTSYHWFATHHCKSDDAVQPLIFKFSIVESCHMQKGSNNSTWVLQKVFCLREGTP